MPRNLITLRQFVDECGNHYEAGRRLRVRRETISRWLRGVFTPRGLATDQLRRKHIDPKSIKLGVRS